MIRSSIIRAGGLPVLGALALLLPLAGCGGQSTIENDPELKAEYKQAAKQQEEYMKAVKRQQNPYGKGSGYPGTQ